MNFTKCQKQNASWILICLCKLVSLCSIMPNCKCSNFITIALTNLFREKIIAMRQWTLIQHSRHWRITIARRRSTEKLQEFYKEYEQWFVSGTCDSHKNDFIQTCANGDAWVPLCKVWTKSKKYHTRIPGLFEVEWEGESIVALCSKTYYCSGKEDKLSCKGVLKCQNDLTKQHYLDVPYANKSNRCTNRGFRI